MTTPEQPSLTIADLDADIKDILTRSDKRNAEAKIAERLEALAAELDCPELSKIAVELREVSA